MEVALPKNPLEIGVFFLATVFFFLVFIRAGSLRAFLGFSRSQWGLMVTLCGASLLLSQLFPIEFPWRHPLLDTHPATATLSLLSAVPYLLATLALNTPAAMVVGLFAGLGRTFGQTGTILDIFTIGLAAAASATLMRQTYAGWAFHTLRRPVVAGPTGRLMIALFITLNVLAKSAYQAGFFAALDLGLFIGLWSIIPLTIEGVVGGAIVMAALWINPKWLPSRGEVPSPFGRTIQRQFNTAFLSFAATIILLSAVIVFLFSARATERVLVAQIADGADRAASSLGRLQDDITSTLSQLTSQEKVEQSEAAAKSAILGRLLPASPQLSEVKLINESGQVIAGSTESLALSEKEREAITAALSSARPLLFTNSNKVSNATLAVPSIDSDGARVVLLAQLDQSVLDNIAAGVADGIVGRGLLVDESARVVADSMAVQNTWQPPTMDQLARQVSRSTGRNVYEISDPQTGARQLVYYSLVPQNGWRVVALLPHATILRQSLGVIGPLALLLLVAAALFYLQVSALGRAIAQPIAEMSRASREIAGGGGLERPVRTQRGDEIGQLSLAFSQMQRALRQRLDELSLLLAVSNEVAATIDIDEGMSAVLQGILRGTGAIGARAIIRNPSSSGPLVFSEGPFADNMAVFDRPIVLHLRDCEELALGTASEIEKVLGTGPGGAGALFARPLKPAGEFQGALFLIYRQPHYFDSDELNLLRTLTGQATVLVQNAYLFAAAEGGRRRLAAILASTTNAVIVTDQTDRILLVNPAMEHAFGLKAREAVGRPVVEALAGAGELWRHLSLGLTAATSGPAGGKLELMAGGRAYLASISTVVNRAGQMMGRVAVLQDVTQLKEVDRLKSDFIAGISHDLRSPLTYMRNYAEMLSLTDDRALQIDYAAKILGGIDRMTRLVNDLLDLARIEAGLNLHFEHIDIVKLLVEVADEYAAMASSSGVRLVVDTPAALPSPVADAALLRRALTNLVTNALKYAPNSGPITLRAEAVGNQIILSVRDHGPGIEPTKQARLFEKFYRGMEGTSRVGGSGLGLAIVKSVADHHHGRVWCHSALGQGATFFLAIPQYGPVE